MLIPAAVRDAAQRSLAAHEDKTIQGVSDLASGQIVKIRSYPDVAGRVISRLALVVDVNSEDETARFLLATPVTESATDLDLVLPATTTGLPFDLLIQGELYGTVFNEQAVAQLAVVDLAYAAAADAALASDGESLELLVMNSESNWKQFSPDVGSRLGVRTGHPLSNSNDPRRAFKELELDDLDSLVRECRRAMDGLSVADGMLDVSLLVPPPPGTDPDVAAEQFLELLDLVSELGTGGIALPSYWLEKESLISQLKRWQSEFGLPASRILDRYVLSEREPIDPLHEPLSDHGEIDLQADADTVMAKALRSKARNGSAVVDIYTTATSMWYQRHHRKFIKEQVGSNVFVRAFPRVLEEIST